ncbi:DUF3261 domain-containing protein [Vibrio sp. HA2012]|uniref:DUF3261 domain-containing protein n=1 Tax=Vibrio sp. HA2012 TaxID=1971595 RepID=UPI000C2BEE90|nr:DUF3261 domain-containing protein [Vibrio sp. HA2012]PJC85801.1 DUF3261 domain-containing protein [Vibrio sp. HA2012]
MKARLWFRSLLIGGGVLLLMACSSVNVSPDNSVQMAGGTSIPFPEPKALESVVSVSQMITATWNGDTQQLPVKLEVDADRVVLAGFSSWGTRLLSLEYSSAGIATYVLPGLEAQLPDPKQVLFYIMVSLWPQDVWREKLSLSGWDLVDKAHTRTLVDASGKVVVFIHYTDINNKLAGDIKLENPEAGYSVVISTLN